MPGRVKTRLIPMLGKFGAASLQRRMTEHCLQTVQTSGTGPVVFTYSGGSAASVRRWLKPFALVSQPQVRGDLGVRMQAALGKALARGYRRVLLVGTDVPGLRTDHLRQASYALSRHDVVLGPSTDGGYWLVGLRRPVDIFQGIDWGTPVVLEQTLAAVRRQNLSVTLLESLNDVDTPEDLALEMPAADIAGPYLSIVIPAFNEARFIERTIARVAGPEREVIVVDGGSRDATALVAKRSGARVIRSARGRAVQQNTGAARAKGRVLLFLHADTLLPGSFDLQIFDTLLDPDVVLGAFRFKTDYDHWRMRLIERTVNLRSRLMKMPYGDQAFFMHAGVFRSIGGFPHTLIAEDLMLTRQLNRIGRIALAPGYALTSGRRWRTLGVWRTTFINYLIAGGCLLGMDTRRLAPLYRLWLK